MKGLRRLDVSVADVVPSYVPVDPSQNRPTTAYKPSKLPPKNKTEMSKDERHSSHLRKRRHAKASKRAEEQRMQVMAKFDPKVRERLEKGKVMESLAGNKNVTIVGHTGGSSSASKKGNGKKEALKGVAVEKRGKKWKHDLTRTLTKDRADKQR